MTRRSLVNSQRCTDADRSSLRWSRLAPTRGGREPTFRGGSTAHLKLGSPSVAACAGGWRRRVSRANAPERAGNAAPGSGPHSGPRMGRPRTVVYAPKGIGIRLDGITPELPFHQGNCQRTNRDTCREIRGRQISVQRVSNYEHISRIISMSSSASPSSGVKSAICRWRHTRRAPKSRSCSGAEGHQMFQHWGRGSALIEKV